MLTQKISLLVFLGLTIYSGTAAVCFDSLLPLSRDGAKASFDKGSFDKMGKKLEWGAISFLRAGQSGRNIGSIRTHVEGLAHKSVLVLGLQRYIVELLKHRFVQ